MLIPLCGMTRSSRCKHVARRAGTQGPVCDLGARPTSEPLEVAVDYRHILWQAFAAMAARWSPGLRRHNSDCKGRRLSTVLALAAFLRRGAVDVKPRFAPFRNKVEAVQRSANIDNRQCGNAAVSRSFACVGSSIELPGAQKHFVVQLARREPQSVLLSAKRNLTHGKVIRHDT